MRLFVVLICSTAILSAVPFAWSTDVPRAGGGAFVPSVDSPRAAVAIPGADSDSDVVPTDPNHMIQPQDVLRVQIFGEEDINKHCDMLIVSQDLTITLPLIGVVSARGRTIGQLQEFIQKSYDKDYLVNPQVSVLVLKYSERFVDVIGSVTNQGRKELPALRNFSIVDALALSGGQTRLADLKHVKLTRLSADGRSEVRIIDVDAIIKANGAETVLLQPGDVIFIPERTL